VRGIRDATSNALASPKDGLTPTTAIAGALHAMPGGPSIGLAGEGRGTASQAASVPSTVMVNRAISDLVNIVASPLRGAHQPAYSRDPPSRDFIHGAHGKVFIKLD